MDEFRWPTGGIGISQPTRLADESPVSAICLSICRLADAIHLSLCLSVDRPTRAPCRLADASPLSLCLSICRPAHKKASKIENLIVFFSLVICRCSLLALPFLSIPRFRPSSSNLQYPDLFLPTDIGAKQGGHYQIPTLLHPD
jgi:hypothetical protein